MNGNEDLFRNRGELRNRAEPLGEKPVRERRAICHLGQSYEMRPHAAVASAVFSTGFVGYVPGFVLLSYDEPSINMAYNRRA